MKYLKCMKLICALSIAIVLSSCGSSGLEGTYTDEQLGLKVTFKSNGKAIAEIMGNEIEYDYELEGNKLKLKISENQSEIWTLEEDGSLTKMGMKLVKKK